MITQKLNFIIPVRHYKSVRNWKSVKLNIEKTLFSISGQVSNNWHCYIVCNKGTDLPVVLSEKFSVIEQDFPLIELPEKIEDPDKYHDMIRMDKGLRVYEGFKKCSPTDYFMVVDYDDFIHQDLSLFVGEHIRTVNKDSSAGWLLRRGYLYSGGYFALLNNRFDEVCGTSNIVSVSFVERFYEDNKLPFKYIKELLGSHRFIKRYMQEFGARYDELPFYGAVYNVGIPNSASQTASVLTSLLSFRKTLRYPRRALKLWLSLRLFSSTLREKYNIRL